MENGFLSVKGKHQQGEREKMEMKVEKEQEQS